MAKKQAPKKAPTPEIAGYRLCVWCKGGIKAIDPESGGRIEPITSPWQLVYAPYWLDGYTQKPAAPGWNKAPIVYGVVDAVMDYKTSDEAYAALQTVPQEHLFKNPDEIRPELAEIFISV